MSDFTACLPRPPWRRHGAESSIQIRIYSCCAKMSGTGVTQPKSRRGRVGSKPVDDYSTEKPFADSRRMWSVSAPKEMRDHVDHLEPLKPSGLDKGLNLAGIVVVEVRFDSTGQIACARAKSGHPIAISAAMTAIKKWTFKPVVSGGVAKGGCGAISIKYRLRDQARAARPNYSEHPVLMWGTTAGSAVSRGAS